MADADVFGAMTADAVLPLTAIRRKFFTCSSVRRGSRRYGLAPKSLAISGTALPESSLAALRNRGVKIYGEREIFPDSNATS